jgi:photosystem II stability/assembly factor-like uncharacterized protein
VIGTKLRSLSKKMHAVYVLPLAPGAMEIYYVVHRPLTDVEEKTLDEVSDLATARQPTKGFIFHTRVLNGRKAKDVLPDGAMVVWERR